MDVSNGKIDNSWLGRAVDLNKVMEKSSEIKELPIESLTSPVF